MQEIEEMRTKYEEEAKEDIGDDDTDSEEERFVRLYELRYSNQAQQEAPEPASESVQAQPQAPATELAQEQALPNLNIQENQNGDQDKVRELESVVERLQQQLKQKDRELSEKDAKIRKLEELIAEHDRSEDTANDKKRILEGGDTKQKSKRRKQ